MKPVYKIIGANMTLLQGRASDEEMANMIGLKSPNSWRARKIEPQRLTLGEMTALCNRYRVDVSAFLTRSLAIT